MRPIPGEKHPTDESIDWTKAMIQQCDDQAYRCPRRDGPIAASGDGVGGRENSELTGQDGAPRSAYSRLINETLPHILQQGRAFFLWKGVPFSDAEELESKLAVKMLDQLSRGNVPGTASAWSKKLQATIFADYLRARYRERTRLGERQDAASLADVEEPIDDEKAESVRVFIEGLPPQERDIVERLQA